MFTAGYKNPFEETIKRMRELSLQRQNEWEEWFTKTAVASEIACPAHNERRRLDPEASVRASYGKDVPQFEVVYHACPRCAADDLLRKNADDLRRDGVIDELVLHASFDNFVCRCEADERNLAQARAFAQAGKGFILMLGPVGTGKSHLSVAVMRAMAGVSRRFTTQALLLKKLRDTYRNDKAEDAVEACKRVRLLVLDELGVSAGGRDEFPMLHDILTTRHAARKPTVLTTNLTTDEELAEVLGVRMHDRLKQSGFAKLWFSGESLRRQMRANY